MPKRTTYKKSKKQRKSNNKTRYRKSKYYSKMVKGGEDDPPYTCRDNNILYTIMKPIKVKKIRNPADGTITIVRDPTGIPTDKYKDPVTNINYECAYPNLLHENGLPITDENKKKIHKYKCYGKAISDNSLPVVDDANPNKKLSVKMLNGKQYSCQGKNNLFINNARYYSLGEQARMAREGQNRGTGLTRLVGAIIR